MKDKPVIILAGGFGTRLKSYLNGMPKPMVNINGKPFLEYILFNLIQNGFKSFIFSLHYKSEIIIEYLESKRNDLLVNCKLQYYVEPIALGTGGAISYILSHDIIEDDFFVLNADTWIKDKLNEMKNLEPNVIALVEVVNTNRYGKVQINTDKIITNFIEKGDDLGKGLINAGFYKFNKKIFEKLNNVSFSLENDLFPVLLESKELKGYVLNTDFIDIGVPKDYLHFCELSKTK